MNTEPLFVPEQLYHRKRDIHARFGGQEQGGMMTPGQAQPHFPGHWQFWSTARL
jgi:hypothetical protein